MKDDPDDRSPQPQQSRDSDEEAGIADGDWAKTGRDQ
jgi:hypothetical protein